jgi:hypothetical protein
MFSFGGSASFTIVTPASKNYADGAGVKFTFERDGQFAIFYFCMVGGWFGFGETTYDEARAACINGLPKVFAIKSFNNTPMGTATAQLTGTVGTIVFA